VRRLLLLLPLALAACAAPAPPPAAPTPEADSARALLARVSPALAADAFRRLDALAYTATVRLDEVDDGAVTASAWRRVRRTPGPDGEVRERLIAADSGRGLPARGAFGSLRLADPIARMLPEEPPYLTTRMRERYRYRLLRERVLDGRRVVGAEAALRDPDDDEAVRRARAWADAGTGAPVAVEVWRASRSAIFDEQGRASVLLQPGPDGRPVPAGGRAETVFDVPFGPARHLRLALAVSDVAVPE
jgi:hypothetical protein